MSGNVFPAVTPPIVAGLPNWFAKASKSAESGFNTDTICFWGDSTTSNLLNFFGAAPFPVTYPTFSAGYLVNPHQKTGGLLANTRILNFGHTGAALAVAMQEPSSVVFNITRLLSASQQIYWPAGSPPAAGDTVTIGTAVWTWITSGATPSGNQVNLGTSFSGSIDNLVTALAASADAQTAQNNYRKSSSLYDTSFLLDIWSKRLGPAGSGQAVACSTAGSVINGAPKLQIPALIVMCYGINDVRTGTTTEDQLVALISRAINRIRATLPTTDIILWGPNSFLADDPSASGAVVPLASAQAYTSLLYNAYARLKNVWPNVVVLQKQDLFGKTCQTYASIGSGSGWMADILHPSLSAQTQMANYIAGVIGYQQPFNQQRANMARVANPTAPHLVYARGRGPRLL